VRSTSFRPTCAGTTTNTGLRPVATTARSSPTDSISWSRRILRRPSRDRDPHGRAGGTRCRDCAANGDEATCRALQATEICWSRSRGDHAASLTNAIALLKLQRRGCPGAHPRRAADRHVLAYAEVYQTQDRGSQGGAGSAQEGAREPDRQGDRSPRPGQRDDHLARSNVASARPTPRRAPATSRRMVTQVAYRSASATSGCHRRRHTISLRRARRPDARRPRQFAATDANGNIDKVRWNNFLSRASSSAC